MLNNSSTNTTSSEIKRIIYEARYCILIATILYALGLLVGWAYPEKFPFLEEQTKKLAEPFLGVSAGTFILKIFAYNIVATYLSMCLIVIFGIIPGIVAALNGLITGWVIASYASGASSSKIALMIVPHGLFEWPAMMISWGVGIWRGFGYRFFEAKTTYKERWQRANKVFIIVVIPLLFAAAIVEGRYHIIKEFF